MDNEHRDLGGPDESVQADTVRALLHDLRGPVSAIRLLSDGSRPSERRLTAIAEQAGWLGALIESALGTGPDRVEAVDLCMVVEEAVGLWRATAPCEIAIDAPASAWGWARPVAVVRALGCLLDNAVRAAGDEGHVVVRVKDDAAAGEVRISILDDGPGLGRIASRTSLGLTTTRAVMAACNGGFRIRPGLHVGTVAEIQLGRATEQQAAG